MRSVSQRLLISVTVLLLLFYINLRVASPVLAIPIRWLRWILFALFNLYKTALLNEHGIDYWDQGYAFFSALVFSKVLLVGDMLGIGQSLRKRALVWVVLGRSLIFAVLIILCHAGLSVIRAWYDAQPVLESIMKIGGGSWLGFWIYAAILFFMLIPLAAFRELSYVLGADVIWKLMTSSERKV